MAWYDIWPKQRANVKRKQLSHAEREYRARVRRNKGTAASKAQNARVSSLRATTLRDKRIENKRIIERNQREIEETFAAAFRDLKEKRRKQRNRRWAKLLEKARVAGYDGLRRWQQMLATPKWANRGAMLALYREARRIERDTGVPHQVDHIVPLLSPYVCGLHCEHNMMVLPRTENLTKGNRVWPDMPEGLQ